MIPVLIPGFLVSDRARTVLLPLTSSSMDQASIATPNLQSFLEQSK